MSADKLKTPLRRLIVGVSVSDVIASFSNVLNPIMIPSGVLAYGNQGPCEAVAFSNHFGAFASMLYTLSLCIYYVHVIKYNTSDRDFATRIEPWLHGISIGYPLLGSIVNLAVGNFNSMGLICWIYSQPLYCADDPDVECIRGANAEAYKLIFAMMPLFVSFIGIVYVMVVISLTVIKQERRNARFRFQVQQTSDGINQNTCHSFFRHLRSRIGNLFCRGPRESDDSDNIPTYATRGMAASQRRIRNTAAQSLLYIAAFIITYTGILVIAILELANTPPPFALLVEHDIFHPLCGFFNILVYTRPKVSTVRRRRPEYWWFQAFWLVVKAGGEMPELPPRQQTATLAVSTAPGNHTDISAMRRRLALASPAQPVSSSIKDDAIDEVSEPLKSTKHSSASFHADDELVEQLELALVQIEEEEFNAEEDKGQQQIKV